MGNTPLPVPFFGGEIGMFGSKKNKEYDVRLTEKQVKDLTKNMSKQERKEFERRQKQAQADRDWDALMLAELFFDD